MAQLETGPVIVVSALLGVAVGLWAAPAAVGMVPLFTTSPATFPVDLHTAWAPALVAGAFGLVVLTVVGMVTSRRIERRASLERLRETV
jgi:ABC-type antimicrobial peptide transport system permease subunit